MSEIRVNTFKAEDGISAPSFPNGIQVTGIVTSTVLDNTVPGDLTVTGNVSVGGTLTYEDVTNIDSVGLVTARTGVKVPAGEVTVGNNIQLGNAGIVTATTFVGNLTGNVTGSGANLTSLPAGQLTGTVADARISTLTASKLTGDLPAISGANLQNLDASDLAYGTVPTARLGSGTADSSTFLRGDSTFQALNGIQQVAYANKVDTQGIDYNAGRTVISGLNATLASAPASGNKIYVSGQMTVGYSGGDPGAAPRWEYSTDNSSWSSVYLSTYMVAGSHSGLDANSNWGVGAGFKAWNDTWTVMCCTLNVMVTANEISNARYFRVTVRQTDNSNDTIWINRPGGGNLGFAPAGTSSLVVMEVKA